jgi:O-antigen ligase
MEKHKLHEQIQTLALALTLFTFPFRPLMLNNICIILLIINWLAQGNLKGKFGAFARNRIALLYAGLYFIFIISFFFSEDKSRAATILERNALILLIPLVLSTSDIRSQVNIACYALVAGCFLGVVICLAHALYRYGQTHQTHYFFYHDLSKSALELHAVYFSFYIAFCILFLIIQLENKWRNLAWPYRAIYLGLVAVFFCFLILLSSKTIIIGLTLLINLLFIAWIIRKSKVWAGVLAIVIINITILVGILKVDYVKDRFLDSLNYNIEFVKKDTYSELTVFTGVTVRLTFWKFVLEILNENNSWWTGMGIGDGDNALHEKAVKKNLYGGNEERGWTDYTSYNAHNQYFQYMLLIGILGLLYFLFLLFTILSYALKHKKALLLLSILLFMLFCFTESVLAVNKGIIFFSIIPPLLIYSGESEPRQSASTYRPT